jgi:hypothetical protein
MNNICFDYVKFTNRIRINGINYTDVSNKSRFNDSCVETKSGLYGFIHKIIVTSENRVFFILQKIVKLLDCFYYPVYEKYKSKMFLFSVSTEFFITKKDCFIKINEELQFLSTFDMTHLFH